jgi:hypothetical protein
MSVSNEAKCVEFYNVEERICDLKLFHLFFKLVEPKGDLEDHLLDSNISKYFKLIYIFK